MKRKRNRLNVIWYNMMKRCYDPKNAKFARYGARGVEVCEDWKNFGLFKLWALSNGYEDNLTIDRINYDGNYEPSNCKWSTNKEQANNRSTNIVVTYKGETSSLKKICDKYNLDYSLVRNRYRKLGWSIEDAIEKPKVKETKNKRYITFNGETLRLYQLAKRIGITTHSLTNRLSSGWSIEKALTTGYRGKRV